jgi:hypothetical protein
VADELALWSVPYSTRLSALTWGEVIAGSSADQQVRVRNLSDLYQALGVTVSFVDVTGHSGASEHYLSTNGVDFADTVDLGDMPPSAVSEVITLRRVTPAATSAGAKACALRLSATSWV